MFVVEINADDEREDEKLATCRILLEYKPPDSVSSTIIFWYDPRRVFHAQLVLVNPHYINLLATFNRRGMY